MQRWEFVLRADDERDLADVGRAIKWVREVFWHDMELVMQSMDGKRSAPRSFLTSCAASVGITLYEPTHVDGWEWDRAIRALRSLAARVMGFRSRKRKPCLSHLEADQIANGYISTLQPALCDEVGVNHDHATANDRCGRKPIRSICIRYSSSVTSSTNFAEGARRFFGFVFASFIQPDGVCGVCGRALGTSRAKRCRTCKARLWQAGLPKEERQRREREKKRRQRQRAKTNTPTTKKGK